MYRRIPIKRDYRELAQIRRKTGDLGEIRTHHWTGFEYVSSCPVDRGAAHFHGPPTIRGSVGARRKLNQPRKSRGSGAGTRENVLLNRTTNGAVPRNRVLIRPRG